MEHWLGVRDSPPEVTLSEVLSHLPPCVVPFCWACFVAEASDIHEVIDPTVTGIVLLLHTGVISFSGTVCMRAHLLCS